MEKERPINSYSEFSPGQSLSFKLRRVLPDGTVRETLDRALIASIHAGGYVGPVLVPEDRDFVLKTTLADPMHHVMRLVYCGFRDLASRTDEVSAQIDHLGTKIIHKVLPLITDGKFHSPDSFGYTWLPTGYAQVIERIDGRGPRFDTTVDEFRLFREAQRELTEVGFDLGLEQVGQIHKDNILGMDNLWIDPKTGGFIWLDTIPGIPHNGPFFIFRFHQDVRNKLGEGKPTFNRIHTDKLMGMISARRYAVPNDEFDALIKEIETYDAFWRRKTIQPRDAQTFFDASDELTDRVVENLVRIPERATKSLASSAKTIFDSTYRQNVALSGVVKARDKGLITEDEFLQAVEEAKGVDLNKLKKTCMIALNAYYFVVGRTSEIMAGLIVYNSLSDNPLLGIVKGLTFDALYPITMRRFGTLLTGKLGKLDLNAAAAIVSIPFIPGSAYTAIPAQLSVSSANKSKLVWHYKVREIFASILGYGSQLEGEVYSKIGKKIEGIGSKT